jgi:hypothetical protein
MITEDQIKGCSRARSFGRFPVITYYNKKLNIILWRSAEPDLTTMSKRSIDDENYLASINPDEN